jgi:hypothetical protein
VDLNRNYTKNYDQKFEVKFVVIFMRPIIAKFFAIKLFSRLACIKKRWTKNFRGKIGFIYVILAIPFLTII